MTNEIKKIVVSYPEFKLVGITTRTTNALETEPTTGRRFPVVRSYFHDALAEKIIHRKRPGTTYCVYTQYESDDSGEYTYFIGEEVATHDFIPEGFMPLTIPAQTYVKFTNGPGVLPGVCRNVWERIWTMDPIELGGHRSYLADFEVYDERAQDHQNIVLDIYIGIHE